MSKPRSETQPDPDALLAHINTEETMRTRGRLKIYLGANAGVGKTYAMLEYARALRTDDVDVVIGIVETHGRRETQDLLPGIPILGRRSIEHGTIAISEFDIDAALARRPAVLLMDELAHTNAPGSRHNKRWQDVEELLGAGIDVHGTLNIQHLESLNDVVARITHVVVRETVPDALFERADEVELIDIPPDDLLRRLADGKIYLGDQAHHATQNFFRKGNLIALRQLALRQVAQRVDAQMLLYRRATGVHDTWPANERIVVGVGPAPSSERLVRAAKRLADKLSAEWIAVFVQTPAYAALSQSDHDRIWQTLRLAEQLGGGTATVSGNSPTEILTFAQSRNASRIVIGKPAHRYWHDRVSGSSLDRIIRSSGDIDIIAISRDDSEPRARVRKRVARIPAAPALFAIVAVATVTVLWLRHRATLPVPVAHFLPLSGIVLLSAIMITTLAVRLRAQAASARDAERRTAALLNLARELAGATEPAEAMRACAWQIGQTFHTGVAILLPDPFGKLRVMAEEVGNADSPIEPDLAVADWVLRNSHSAGRGTDTLPLAPSLYVPLLSSGHTIGVAAIGAGEESAFRNPEQLHVLESLCNQLAQAVERIQRNAQSLRNAQGIDLESLKTVVLHAEDVVVSSLLEECIAALRARATTRRVELVSDCADVHLAVHADRTQLSRIITGLIARAVENANDGGRAVVSCDDVGDVVQISIADDGAGIALEDQSQFFNPFARIPARHIDEDGLGLAVARAVVAAHGGTIWVDSGPGPGCIVSISLPRSDVTGTDERS